MKKTTKPLPAGSWVLVWEGPEPTAGLAQGMLENNGLDVHAQRLELAVRLSVRTEDAETAQELLKDWAL
ncbi:MAG: hypothetical protein HY554_08435 [Elusimicrobia bacterium]|nr:hypothetical protein [Elusimicrobiota bacterium]